MAVFFLHLKKGSFKFIYSDRFKTPDAISQCKATVLFWLGGPSSFCPA